jgi:predicted thioesterase
MDIKIPPKVSAERRVKVTPSHSAREVGSGNVDVLATPMMIALMEAASLRAREVNPEVDVTVIVADRYPCRSSLSWNAHWRVE